MRRPFSCIPSGDRGFDLGRVDLALADLAASVRILTPILQAWPTPTPEELGLEESPVVIDPL